MGQSKPAQNQLTSPLWMHGLTGNSYSPDASYASPNLPSPFEGQDMTGNGVDPTTYQPKNQGMNPILQRMQAMSSGQGGGGPGRFDSMAGNLLGMYSAYRNRKNVKGQIKNLNSLYSPNSPYAKQLESNLMRQDAAAGRRSQVGPRQVELQARLAEMNGRLAPQLQSLYSQSGANRDRFLSGLMRLGMGGMQGGGGFDWLQNMAQKGQNWWDLNQNGGSTAYMNSDWAPGEG
jgi:hypothetical protein